MTDIEDAVDLHPYTNSARNPWFVAYMTLRAVVVDPAHAAAPVKSLHGALTVVESDVARRLHVPLSTVYEVIQDDYNRLHDINDAKDGGGSSLG